MNNNHEKDSLGENGLVRNNLGDIDRKESFGEENSEEEGFRKEESWDEDFEEKISIKEDERVTDNSSRNRRIGYVSNYNVKK